MSYCNERGCSGVVRAREQAPRTVQECLCGSFIDKGVPVSTDGVLTEEEGVGSGLFPTTVVKVGWSRCV